jgi:hypothetical protein
MSWAILVVLGRILAEPDVAPPEVNDSVMLLIKRQGVTIGCTGDAGVIGDAATDAFMDAPIDAVPDSGIADAGIDDGGVPDAGVTDAGTCEMIPGDAVTMIVQPHVSITADGTRFAVLLVTPQRPLVEVKSHVFEPLAAVTAPVTQTKVVEVEDKSLGSVCAGCGGDGGGGCGGDFGDDSWYDPPPLGDASLGDGGIIEEMVGPYQFVRAQPTSSQELAGWLDQLGYAYMPADLDAVAPYIALGYHVVAMRIASDAGMSGSLMPVALTWPGSELRVPAALGRGASGPGLFTVYISAEGKYELPGATIRFAKYTGAQFLTRNELVLDQSKPAENDPIAVRTDGTEVQEVNVVTKYVHVPVEVPCDNGGCCSDCNARPQARIDWGVLAIAVLVVLRRRRRR